MAISKQLALHYIRTKFRILSKVSKKLAAEQAFDLFVTPQSRFIKEMPPVFKKAEVLTTVFNGLRIKGYRFQHPAEKKVLILHGFESTVLNFDPYVQPLLKKGYEVLAFDAPAHGGSAGRRINALDYKNFILHLLQEYGPVTHFITHSFGGLALSLALEELPHDDTWKAVLIAPATESTTAMKNFAGLVELDESVQEEFKRLIERANNRPLSWYSVARASQSIKAQLLFLQDKQDFITPLSDLAPIMAQNRPNFRFVLSDGLGHSRIYRNKHTVDAVMNFL